MTTPLITATTKPAAMNAADLTPAGAWSRRVRRVGGFIQAAFAAFWLARASLAIGGRAEDVLIAASGIAVIGVFTYAIRVMAGTAPRPAGRRPGGLSGRGPPLEQRVAGAGETIVVPAGVPHSEGNPGPGEIQGMVELHRHCTPRSFTKLSPAWWPTARPRRGARRATRSSSAPPSGTSATKAG